MRKDFIVEVRIKYGELMDNNELQMMALFSRNAESVIKDKLIDRAVNDFIANNSVDIEIDAAELKELAKKRLVDAAVDKILGD